MLALAAGEAEFGDRGRGIGAAAAPGTPDRSTPGDHAARRCAADLGLVGLDQRVQRGGVDVAALDQQRSSARTRICSSAAPTQITVVVVSQPVTTIDRTLERVRAAHEWTTTSPRESRRTATTVIVAAAGEIDFHRRRPPRLAVSSAREDCDRLRLDLTAIEFIDSTGLGGLLELRSTLRSREVTFEIAAGDGPVRQAVEITGLGELLAH